MIAATSSVPPVLSVVTPRVPRVVVMLFQQQFAPLVRAGSKRITIRRIRKKPILEGDILDLREWTAEPYRSKQKKIGLYRCTGTEPIQVLAPGLVSVADMRLTWAETRKLAENDGFPTADAMLTWFERNHTLPFEGVIIGWDPTPVSLPTRQIKERGGSL